MCKCRIPFLLEVKMVFPRHMFDPWLISSDASLMHTVSSDSFARQFRLLNVWPTRFPALLRPLHSLQMLLLCHCCAPAKPSFPGLLSRSLPAPQESAPKMPRPCRPRPTVIFSLWCSSWLSKFSRSSRCFSRLSLIRTYVDYSFYLMSDSNLLIRFVVVLLFIFFCSCCGLSILSRQHLSS